MNLRGCHNNMELKAVHQEPEFISTYKYEGWIPRRDNKGYERIVTVGLNEITCLTD